MIRDFITRNKSVFVIGLLTLAIFLSIITISEVRRVRKGNDSPKLIRVEDSTATETSESSPNDETVSSSPNIWDVVYSETDKIYGILLIGYTDKGFVPKNAKALLGQKVKWANKTGFGVYITERTPFFDELKTPLFLPANGVLEFRLYKDGSWDYQEPGKGFSGNITILKP